jgi:hypothetical protein
MTGTAVESTTSVRDAELYQLIGQARELWGGCQKVYENHDKTVETYREMEERAMADFLDPHLELEKEIALVRPATPEGLRAKAQYALDYGDHLACVNEPLFASIVFNVAGRETPPWDKLDGLA